MLFQYFKNHKDVTLSKEKGTETICLHVAQGDLK